MADGAGAASGLGEGPGTFWPGYGGAEFAVVLPGATLDGAVILADRLRERVEVLHLSGGSDPEGRGVTISVGVAATSKTREVPAEDLVLAADRALYEAKQRGRNRVACAPILPEESETRETS